MSAPTFGELLEMFKSLRGELYAVNGLCRDPAWIERNLHPPNCWCVWIGEIDAMLQRASNAGVGTSKALAITMTPDERQTIIAELYTASKTCDSIVQLLCDIHARAEAQE